MALPPGEGSIRESASNEFNFACLLAWIDLEDRIGLFEPFHKCNDSSNSIECLQIFISEFLVGAFPDMTMTSSMVQMIFTTSSSSSVVGFYLRQCSCYCCGDSSLHHIGVILGRWWRWYRCCTCTVSSGSTSMHRAAEEIPMKTISHWCLRVGCQ